MDSHGEGVMESKASGDVALLMRIVDEAYEKKAWHGPNLRGSLRGVGAQEAAWRPGPNRHNIWELAVHAAYWKYAVWRRLNSVKRGSFPIEGSNYFRRPESPTEKAWRADLALLDEQHRRLRKTIGNLSAKRLREKTRGSKVSNEAILCGIAAHDVYHAGQIQLVKRLFRDRDQSPRSGRA
jgi:hypothetical protein